MRYTHWWVSAYHINIDEVSYLSNLKVLILDHQVRYKKSSNFTSLDTNVIGNTVKCKTPPKLSTLSAKRYTDLGSNFKDNIDIIFTVSPRIQAVYGL